MGHFGKHYFGWRPDVPDHRDFLYGAPPRTLLALPDHVDLRAAKPALLPPVYDQGRIGSCTANAIAAAVQFDRKKSGEAPDFVPSRLFIYYNERAIEHDVGFDKGAQIRDGIKSIVKQGVCPETMWTYDDTPADPDTEQFGPGVKAGEKPTAACYAEAKRFEALAYLRVAQNLQQLSGCLAEGYPFVFGITVYRSFWDAKGVPQVTTPLPTQAERAGQPVGGHAILGVGYDNHKDVVICRNSWGAENQDHGYFYLPYAYVTDATLASDFWTVRRMTS
jgi:C1A family cysteine protease